MILSIRKELIRGKIEIVTKGKEIMMGKKESRGRKMEGYM